MVWVRHARMLQDLVTSFEYKAGANNQDNRTSLYIRQLVSGNSPAHTVATFEAHIVSNILKSDASIRRGVHPLSTRTAHADSEVDVAGARPAVAYLLVELERVAMKESWFAPRLPSNVLFCGGAHVPRRRKEQQTMLQNATHAVSILQACAPGWVRCTAQKASTRAMPASVVLKPRWLTQSKAVFSECCDFFRRVCVL